MIFLKVGNAVPPPLAKAIGLEILKAVYKIDSKVKKSDSDFNLPTDH